MGLVILIADDEPGAREPLAALLGQEHEVILCHDGEEAIQILEKKHIDLVLTDNLMPKLHGLDVIKKGKSLSPSTSFILMTAHGTIDQAILAIKFGADDYLTKPFEFPEVLLRVKRVEEVRAYHAERVLRSTSSTGLARIIGRSPAMEQARQFAQTVSTAPSSVLLLGASGCGKEVLARAIHESGPRASGPFVAVNCATLSEQLLESELFGHEKGAFTGATTSKPGKFELAKGGTIFLDEVGEIPIDLQAKLLRVLQEREFCRVGGVKQLKSDARVIAATNRPLKEMSTQGKFREDLYFRLNVISFELKPLCDRRDDIPDLIQFFWERLSREFGKAPRLTTETLEQLKAYSYPGNIRELQNLLERLMVLSGSNKEVLPEHLPSDLRGSARTTPAPGSVLRPEGLTATLDQIEENLVVDAFHRANGNQVKAAELLKITRGALQYKLKKYGILKTEEAA